MDNAHQLWLDVKSRLQNAEHLIGKTEYEELIQPIDTIHKVSGGYIYLVVSSMLEKYRLEKFYLEKMNQVLVTITNEVVKFKIMTAEAAEKEKESKIDEPFQVADTVNKRVLRPEYTFDNFVTGESNRFAFLTAMKVAESPHVTVNPLYIFGEVGLGKTHLMTAIGHFVLDNNINANVVYTTAQQFAEDYFTATTAKKPVAIENFYQHYREAELLLVDDVQFLSGKTKTQEEFFKVFEYLFENNRQIVLTSDRPASELENIMARLKSRFSWGVLVDIKKPDLNLRKSILKRKLPFLIKDYSEFPEDVIEYIALHFDDNVRDLEGALRRFIYYCVSLNVDFSIENAQVALDAIISRDKTSVQPDYNDVIEQVKTSVARYFNVSMRDLASQSRRKDLVYPRQIAIYIIRTLFDVPLKKVGEFFGGRDHATVAHAEKKIASLIESDWAVKQDVENLSKKFKEETT
ncbi:MAG: chromosomal replication initiator protein DnaA [Bacilli bacterium]|jgi:chromosomal replication initiator protein|nr:chromosomal replication initiator protein DnaA [Bacilli bacterium]HHU24084.1 chromosomal replication initiator protein DnaA [Acholeplasmataceae bacterium]